MKNVMIVALLSVGICVAGDAAHNAVGAPLQVPVLFLIAAAAHGNNERIHVQKPKHRAQPKSKKRDSFRPTKEKDHCRGGYRVKR